MLVAGAVILAACLCGCKTAPQANTKNIKAIDAALDKGVAYLLAAQSPDGAWRSKTYGAMKDGASLTPLAMEAVVSGEQRKGSAEAARKGMAYLASLVNPDGSINAGEYGLIYPLYTSSMAAIMLMKTGPQFARQKDVFLKMVQSTQLTEPGWQPSDPEYGGWGYALAPPRKPAPGKPREMFVESNLSATIFGIGALRVCKAPTEDALKKALIFVKRCQNYQDDKPLTVFDDGGFFFIPNDETQNKGGAAGREPDGTLRFNSYGSMTCDGIRGLVRCGLAPDSPRVKAAVAWLAKNFSVEHNPGRFAGGEREEIRDATYYYYCWSLAHAMNALNIDAIDTPDGKVDWRKALAEALIKRQKPDGSWRNTRTDAKEDDPLIATSFATAALSICRLREVGGPPHPTAESRPATAPRN